ncbi:tyrosine-type recombinase/integrase [Planktomarina temperata]|nr:tyrosine-type recombinase/integrase [Planktomarina temperata]
MLSIIHCNIDRRAIEKATKQRKALGTKVTLVDPSGLRLAINAQSASWTYNYRRRGVDYYGKRHPQKTIKVGDPVTMTPQEARFRVEEIKAEVRAGGDPVHTIEQAKLKAERADFKQRASSFWLETYRVAFLGDGSKHKNDEFMHARTALLELNLLEAPPQSISAKALRELVMLHEAKLSTGRHRFGALSRFLDFLVDEDVIEHNPARDLSRRHRPKTPLPRDTFYSIDELKKLWQPREKLSSNYLVFVRFMIACPLRMSEAANLTFNEVLLPEREIRLSSSMTKNSESFSMPLTGLMIEQLNFDNSDNVSRLFQLSSKVGQPMSAWSYFNKTVRVSTGVLEFNLHDLRRTFSSLMSEHSDFSESLVDSLLNHKRSATRQGVMRHYQHAKNLKQRREVMEWWCDFLEREVING